MKKLSCHMMSCYLTQCPLANHHQWGIPERMVHSSAGSPAIAVLPHPPDILFSGSCKTVKLWKLWVLTLSRMDVVSYTPLSHSKTFTKLLGTNRLQKYFQCILRWQTKPKLILPWEFPASRTIFWQAYFIYNASEMANLTTNNIIPWRYW